MKKGDKIFQNDPKNFQKGIYFLKFNVIIYLKRYHLLVGILMICPVCHKREATESVVRVFGNIRTEGHVCPACVDAAYLLDANGFYKTFFQQDTRACRRCGRTLGEIMNTLLVGCPHCYVDFQEELKPLIEVLQRRGEG